MLRTLVRRPASYSALNVDRLTPEELPKKLSSGERFGSANSRPFSFEFTVAYELGCVLLQTIGFGIAGFFQPRSRNRLVNCLLRSSTLQIVPQRRRLSLALPAERRLERALHRQGLPRG